MRRIIIAIGTTLTGLALLASWPTSWNRPVQASAGALASGTASTDDASSGASAGDTSVAASSGEGSSGDGDGTSSGGGGSDGGTTATDDAAPDDATDQAASSGTATYTGAPAATRYGDVQVEITVTDGVLTAARAVAYPHGDRRDQQINAYAIPVLEEQTVATQGAVDLVTGATVTSRGYAQSLQDALDQAAL